MLRSLRSLRDSLETPLALQKDSPAQGCKWGCSRSSFTFSQDHADCCINNKQGKGSGKDLHPAGQQGHQLKGNSVNQHERRQRSGKFGKQRSHSRDAVKGKTFGTKSKSGPGHGEF